MGIAYVENLANTRKEATRRQRIEAEQRRRDELRDGYAKLKDALPVSNQKSSKVSLLERATKHIIQLEQENKEMQSRIAFLEQESMRLRALNEKISLSSDGTPSPEMGRHLSPQPDATPTHSLTSVRGQQPPSEHSSPSASEGGH
jgi:predicted RNase H-like nuclease (RuvC/YqgF family)